MDRLEVIKYLEDVLETLYDIEELNDRNNAHSEELSKHINYVNGTIEFLEDKKMF